jgi:hypothetical protein
MKTSMAVEEPSRNSARSLANKGWANLRPPQPGEVRNPGGRPKMPAEVREAAMALTPEAIKTLGDIMRDPSTPPATRVAAAEKILDRALGRPAQQVEVKGEKRDLLEYSIAELVAIAHSRRDAETIEGEASVAGERER